jgi:hypothetical protein
MPYRHDYDPNQPRVPKGHPDGGRWTDGGHGQDTILQEAGRLDGADSREPTVREASLLRRLAPLLRLQRTGPAGLRDIELGLQLFALQSAFNSRDKQAIIEFRANDYQRTGSSALQFVAARSLTREEVGDICKKLDDVQRLANKAGAKVRARPLPMTPRQFGTFVHTALRDKINGDKQDEKFRAEVSLLKTYDETGMKIPESERKEYEKPYGKKGSIRLDVVENVGNGTVCVYDLKTGLSVLDMKRMTEIAGRVFQNEKKYGPVKRIIVTEVRLMQ